VFELAHILMDARLEAVHARDQGVDRCAKCLQLRGVSRLDGGNLCVN
jgi:hypothetical protein